MSDRPTAQVYVAVPVWRGQDVVAETLRSLVSQTCTEWRAEIAVDGADEESAEACRPFLCDPRITMEVQKERLGWARNLNWLMARCDADFFVYWQQDDLCEANYLETLLRYAAAHPEAACSFSDVQWFGARSEREHTPSVTGPVLQRVLTQIETLSFVPFRGLIRRQALAGAGPLRLEANEAAFADLVWGVQLAREGEMHRVGGTLYLKRAHAQSAHGRWIRWPAERRRAAWIECALGVLEAALSVVPSADHGRLLEVVVGRFALARPGRNLLFDPAGDGPAAVAVFAAELAAEARRRFGIAPSDGRRPAPAGIAAHLATWLRRRPGPCASPLDRHWDCKVGPLLKDGERHPETLTALAADLTRGSRIRLGRDAPGMALLGPGWCSPEHWGTWSGAAIAYLSLPPLPGEGPWRVTLEGKPYGGGLRPGEARRIAISAGTRTKEVTYTAGQRGLALVIEIDPEAARRGAQIVLGFPDVRSPADLGLSADERLLGFGATALTAARG